MSGSFTSSGSFVGPSAVGTGDFSFWHMGAPIIRFIPDTMPIGRLEAALVVSLRDVVAWESALDDSSIVTGDGGTVISVTGTLHPVQSADVFDPTAYQLRDRQLAFRDLIMAAAVVEVSAYATDVWNSSAPKPILQGPAPIDLQAPVASIVTENGTRSEVRHVGNSSVPFDAADQTDRDLYGRDALIYEVLAQTCAGVFPEPPITSKAPTISGISAWSLADGQAGKKDVNTALLLDRDLFRDPDRNLAERDNQNAGYVARLAQILKNPFAYANRLYAQATGTSTREPDIYVLSFENTVQRIWTADPALSNRNRIVYDIALKTLTWTRERTDEAHTPQLFALSIPGIEAGQTLQTVAMVPEKKDAQYWRQRASAIIPSGVQYTDEFYLPSTANGTFSGGLQQVDCASFTVPGNGTLTLPYALGAGNHRVAILATPSATVELPGHANLGGRTGAGTGADFDVGVVTVGLEKYLVEGGDGIVYDGSNYYAGQTFSGVDGVTTYAQIDVGNPSTVRQYAMAWSVALPLGSWRMKLEYSNTSGTSTGFGVSVRIGNQNVLSDAVTLPFSGANGTLYSSAYGTFDVASTVANPITVFWTYGNGQLHIRKITLENLDVTECRMALSGTINTGESHVDTRGTRNQPEVLLFRIDHQAETPVKLILNSGGTASSDDLLPIQLCQVSIQTVGTYSPTPNAVAFQNWRDECVRRAERSIQDSFRAVVKSYGTGLPVFYQSGTAWTDTNTESWVGLIETQEPRLREIDGVASGAIADGRMYEVVTGPVTYDGTAYATTATFDGTATATTFTGGTVRQVGALVKSEPGHIGKPCLIPNGVQFSDSGALAVYNGSNAYPVFAACQPWMIRAGMYTVQSDFWMPDQL